LKKKSHCYICDEICTKLKATHIFREEEIKLFEFHSKFPIDLPASIDEISNGLLLCTSCYNFFESDNREIRINSNGVIIIADILIENKSFNLLNNKPVWWANYIGKYYFPSNKLLELHFNLQNRKKNVNNLNDDFDFSNDDDDNNKRNEVEKSSGISCAALLFIYFYLFLIII
jgi:hypothetical protein